jgi:2-dehydro-3-deoxyphosphogluconate aldolase/(4S)-4-hydroxy-2-oxoglutarate aldolase
MRSKRDICRTILEIGLVPVVRASSAKLAFQAVDALRRGGVTIVEITMTVPGAVEVIRALVKESDPEVLVGAGTVLDAEAARQCYDAGAAFLVSPSFDQGTLAFAKQHDLLLMAGALTPTEVIHAWKAGADVVKVFPCGQVGGASYIKALRGPLPQILLVPTGGVRLDNVAGFIRAGAAALGVGGELVDPNLLASGNHQEITQRAKQFLSAIQSARVASAPPCALAAPRD